MVDFHSHILPGVDDGPETLEESLSMLRSSFLQGVDAMISTSHFYGNEEFPRDFLKRRNAAAKQLYNAILLSSEVFPRVILGSEVLYFPGISDADEMNLLCIRGTKCILIEPPMMPWSDDMLDDIRELKSNFGLTPIIAHVDRYMSMLRDNTLLDRVLQRNMIVQVNGTYFLNPKTRSEAFSNLNAGKIHLVGSDSHNMDTRQPNLGNVWKLSKMNDAEKSFKQLHQNAAELLMYGRL